MNGSLGEVFLSKIFDSWISSSVCSFGIVSYLLLSNFLFLVWVIFGVGLKLKILKFSLSMLNNNLCPVDFIDLSIHNFLYKNVIKLIMRKVVFFHQHPIVWFDQFQKFVSQIPLWWFFVMLTYDRILLIQSFGDFLYRWRKRVIFSFHKGACRSHDLMWRAGSYWIACFLDVEFESYWTSFTRWFVRVFDRNRRMLLLLLFQFLQKFILMLCKQVLGNPIF